jgi:ketosteroid isomerase-like protein
LQRPAVCAPSQFHQHSQFHQRVAHREGDTIVSTTVNQWLEGYRQAWEQRDADAAALLFTEDATYAQEPYGEPSRGRAGVHEYWVGVTATQEDIKLRYGTPVVDGSRAAVEWWVTMRNGGADVTLAGEFFLVFDESGLCSALREYWHFSEGQLQPQAGWGE